jgi:hypothetical protein
MEEKHVECRAFAEGSTVKKVKVETDKKDALSPAPC